MKYPKMNKTASHTVRVPSLSGGINLRDSLNMCNDNQLTDSLNMWYKDGVLKTRQGKRLIESFTFSVGATSDSNVTYDDLEVKRQCHSNITKTVDGKTYTLVSYLYAYKGYRLTSYNDGGEAVTYYDNYSTLDFYWTGADGILNQYPISISVEDRILNYFPVVSPTEMYLFLKRAGAKEIYKYDSQADHWNPLSDEEIYAPLVMTNCLSPHGLSGSIEEVMLNEGVMFEGFNLIGNRYKIQYSTVNKNLLNDVRTKITMIYPLYYDAKEFVGSVVNAKLVSFEKLENGNVSTDIVSVEHSVKISSNAGWDYEVIDKNNPPKDNLFMGVLQHRVCFFDVSKYDNPSGYSYVTKDDYIENNLEITAPCPNDTENMDKIFNMTRAEWFGGAAAGIKGGTRLFLGGNTEENEQSLIAWSGLNNPLYFSENCYSYVGNSMSAVTAFGKQSDMLVIFKENELYYTQYTQNTEITAEDLINQSVVDYQASRVYFPLVQIHSGIGCDCPDTVQLCRNRLVWADKKGCVYTLTNNNQFSERNIFCVSDMIHKKLNSETELKNAYSVDYNGYYMLFCGGRVYLMDYNSYGYQYASSFSKEEDANIRIPWYYWDLGETYESFFYTADNRLMCFSYGIGTAHRELELYTYDSDTDCGEPISCFAQTKFFDFGIPNRRKNVINLGVTFGNNGGKAIKVTYLTDSGELADTVVLCSDATDARDSGFIKSRILSPAIRQILRFAARFECEGNMAIEGINITYRLLGGAR